MRMTTKTQTGQRTAPNVLKTAGLLMWGLALALLITGHASAQTHVYESQKVKTREQWGICVEDGFSAIWGWWIESIDFTPASGTILIAPGSGDPGGPSADATVVQLYTCWVNCGASQCCAKFDFQFPSLRDVGEWTIVVDGIGAAPSLCVSDGCDIVCEPEALFDLTTLIYHLTVWNDPPQASPSHSPTPAWNATVTLRANSSDPDGGSRNHTWSILSKPSSSSKTLSGATSANPTITFNSDNDIGDWQFRLHVDDDEGERKTFTHSFTVPNVPPNISLTGDDIDALQTLTVSASPPNDVDGGPLTFEWTVLTAPPGAQFAAGDQFTTRVVSFVTTDADIGDWDFQCVATDDETPSATDTETISVRVRNVPPEIHFAGTDYIDIGDSIHVETTFLNDLDNLGSGGLTFQWDIVQAPSGVTPFVQYDFSTMHMIDIPTGPDHAGTWIFELTVTDDEDPPWQESVFDEFVVLVNAPPVAQIDGDTLVGSLSLPLVLTAENSFDPDSPCLSDSFRCHDTLDGSPAREISGDIVRYDWILLDVPAEHFPEFVPGSVDDVFGVAAHSESMTLNTGDIEAGEWTFQLTVHDAEDNVDSTTVLVEIVDENVPPYSFPLPTYRRYDVDAFGDVATAVRVDGSLSYDLDNIILGDVLSDGLGITDYSWSLRSFPPSCAAVAPPPSGATESTYTLFPAGFVPLECQGTYVIELTVTDDDAIPLTASGVATITIGNCPSILCIDHPTQLTPAQFDFTDDTDILIFYHLDSALYADPVFAFGAFVQLSIFHESDLTTAFYSDWDPNVLPSSFGGLLGFHWNGFGDSNERPLPGKYSVQLDVFDSTFGTTAVSAVELDAILIAVSEPRILPSSDGFVDYDDLVAGSDFLSIDWEIVGSAAADSLQLRVYDSSDTPVFTDVIPPASSGTYHWDALISGVVVAPGNYTIELTAVLGGSTLGTSPRHPVTVYRLSSFVASSANPVAPAQFLLLQNEDDDDADGAADSTQTGAVPGENDLGDLAIVFEPPDAPGELVLRAASGGANVKVWTTAEKTSELSLPNTWTFATDTVPASVFVEGVLSGETDLELTYRFGGGDIAVRSITAAVVNIDLDLDTDMNGTVNVVDDRLETQNQAIVVNVNNDGDGGAIDSLNGVIDGATDKAELTELILRGSSFLPAGATVSLKVNDKSKVRIFDETDTARIGPAAADGGPDADTFSVPVASLTGGDLTYLIECVHPEDPLTISLVLESGGVELMRDEVKASLNVNRTPTGGAPRYYAGGEKSQAGMVGVEADLNGAKPIISWSPSQPQMLTTSFWISIVDGAVNSWLQTGVRTIRSAAGADSEELYFEFVPDRAAVSGTPADPTGYQIFIKPAAGWTTGTFKVEVTNTATGRAEAFHGGVSWKFPTDARIAAASFSRYMFYSEPKQSIARLPGSTATKATVRNIRFKDAAGWHAGNLIGGELRVYFVDGRGTSTIISPVAPATTAQNGHGHVNWISGDSFEIWDDR